MKKDLGTYCRIFESHLLNFFYFNFFILIFIVRLGFTLQKLFWRFSSSIGMELFIGKKLVLGHSIYRAGSVRAIFNLVSKVIWDCIGFALVDWFRKLVPPSRPIRCNSETNRDLVTRVFPHLRPSTCINYEFSLAL